TNTAFMDTWLFAHKTSYDREPALGSGRLRSYSNAASATTQAPPPPTAPSNLTAAAASSSQINLTWTASSGAVTSYLVERCQEPEIGRASCRESSTITDCSDRGHFASRSYTTRLQ